MKDYETLQKSLLGLSNMWEALVVTVVRTEYYRKHLSLKKRLLEKSRKNVHEILAKFDIEPVKSLFLTRYRFYGILPREFLLF